MSSCCSCFLAQTWHGWWWGVGVRKGARSRGDVTWPWRNHLPQHLSLNRFDQPKRHDTTFSWHLRVCHHGPAIDWSRQINHSRAICFLHYFLIIALCLQWWTVHVRDGGFIARFISVLRAGRLVEQLYSVIWVHWEFSVTQDTIFIHTIGQNAENGSVSGKKN